jgi:hypothetical protein
MASAHPRKHRESVPSISVIVSPAACQAGQARHECIIHAVLT